MNGLDFMVRASGAGAWLGMVRLNITTFHDENIVADFGAKLSIKEAKRLIDELVSAVNEVEAREGNN